MAGDNICVWFNETAKVILIEHIEASGLQKKRKSSLVKSVVKCGEVIDCDTAVCVQAEEIFWILNEYIKKKVFSVAWP